MNARKHTKVIKVNGTNIKLSRYDIDKDMMVQVRRSIKSVLTNEVIGGRIELPYQHPAYGEVLKVIEFSVML